MSLLKYMYVFDGGASKRYHTVDTLRTQDIAAHSFGVAWLCELLTGGAASKNLIMTALAHDLAEQQTGDMPAPAKRALGFKVQMDDFERRALAAHGFDYEEKLTEEEHKIFKMADAIDGCIFCLRERLLGNRKISPVYQNFYAYSFEHGTVPQVGIDILMHINDQMEDLENAS